MFGDFTHYQQDAVSLVLGDCLAVMACIADASIDLILTDLPYGTTYAKFDSLIPFEPLWAHYCRIIKPSGPIVLTASQPFTAALVMSNPGMFRCEWIWDKKNPTNFGNANRQPLKSHESVLVFGKQQTVYRPQKTRGKPNHPQGGRARPGIAETMLIDRALAPDNTSGLKFPTSIVTFAKHSSQGGLHPTQKPVDLLAYFIRTYSDAGDVVLDSCMGSGSTGVACQLTGRRFIGIDLEPAYYAVARDRMFPFAFANDAVTSTSR